jgi:hypothetical protein
MKSEFEKELESLINRHSKENGSNTPDFILADYLKACLDNFDIAVTMRSKWYGDIDNKVVVCPACKGECIHTGLKPE